jgi:hypothetical protein
MRSAYLQSGLGQNALQWYVEKKQAGASGIGNSNAFIAIERAASSDIMA